MNGSVRNSGICILGGGGFLGSRLAESLLQRENCPVEVIDTTFERLSHLPDGLIRTTADVSQSGVIESVVERHDVIVSTTALCNPALYNTRPLDVIHASFTHLVPLVDLCARHQRRLIHFSTCEVYGDPKVPDSGPVPPMSEDGSDLVLGPISQERWTYAAAKQLLERYIWASGVHHGLDFTIVRPFNVIGSRMDFIPGVDGEGIPRVLACFMNALLRGEDLQLVDGGTHRRSFVALDDFTEAVLRIVQRKTSCSGQIINIGNPGNEVSIAQLAQQLAEVFRQVSGQQGGGQTVSVSAAEFYGPGYGDSQQRIPDIEKARRLLDWEPEQTLAQMLPEIVRDYLERYRSLIPEPGSPA